MRIAEQEDIRKILRKLAPLYPEGKVFALSGLDDDLREQLNSAYLRYGYANLGDLLRDLGYEIISASAARDLRCDVLYAPGCEPEPIRTKVINMRWLFDQYYPDGVIRGSLQADHKSLYSTASALCMWLGYADIGSMLEAYGYTYEGGAVGRPENDYQRIVDLLLAKYENGPKPKNMGALIFENPELRSQLKTLQNKAPELFGMSLKAFFTDLGLFADKAERQAAAAPAAASKQDAALAALQARYAQPEAAAHGTYDDALRALHGLTLKQNKAGQLYIFRAISCPQELLIPYGVDFISAGAFRGETNLRTVTLPPTVKELAADTFSGCTALEKVHLPDGLESIGERAFSGCTALQRMDLPGSVTLLDKAAFSGCTALTEVSIPCLTARVADDAFDGCPYQYEPFSDLDCTDPDLFLWTAGKKGTVILSGYTGTEPSIRVPSIVNGAVVTTIGVGAFQGSQILRSVVLPESVTTLQKDAFRDCSVLERVHLSDSITKITSTTFSGCSALSQINIPHSVSELKHNTFWDCPLQTVHIGKGLRTLPTDLFLRYSYNANAVDMNWQTCLRSVSRVVIDPENPWLRAGENAIFSADGKTLLNVFHDCPAFTVPDGVEAIGPFAFADMRPLQEVTFPDSLRLIDEGAFRSTSLRSIHFPAGIRQLGKNAFHDCRSLSSVLFEEGVEEIGSYAFDGCPIVSVLLPSTIRSLGTRCFSCFGGYNDKMLDLRIADTNPNLRADGTALYQLNGEEKVLTTVYQRTYKELPDFGPAEFRSYAVEEGTTAIADDAFAGCLLLEELTLPHGLVSIGSHAFAHTGMPDIVLPATVQSVGAGAFAANRNWYGNRVGLQEIRVDGDQGPLFVENGALYLQKEDGTCALVTYFGSDSIVTISDNTTEIYPEAFCNCDILELRLPQILRSIGEGAFKGCNLLRRLSMNFLQDDKLCSAAVYLPQVTESAYLWGTSLRDQMMDCIRSSSHGTPFDFTKYDSLFASISGRENKVLVAVDRLKTELHLTSAYAENYRRFLRSELSTAIDVMIGENDADGMALLSGLPEFDLKALDTYIAAANRAGSTAVQALLMDLKNARVGFDFSFDLDDMLSGLDLSDLGL